MTIRRATKADLDTIRSLCEAMEEELGGPEWVRETWEEELEDVQRRLRDSAVFLAEEDAKVVGLLGLDFRNPKIPHVQSVYVTPDSRRRGIAAALLGEAAAMSREHGHTDIELDVLASNHKALAVYERLGFVAYQQRMSVSLDELGRRLGAAPSGESMGRLFVRTRDESAIQKAVAQFVPRLGRS